LSATLSTSLRQLSLNHRISHLKEETLFVQSLPMCVENGASLVNIYACQNSYILLPSYKSMKLVERLDKLAKTVDRLNEGIFVGLQVSADGVEAYNGRITTFFKEASRDPIETFRELYGNVLTYFRK
jgi:hypothetical protein